jgi:hypothetical protein
MAHGLDDFARQLEEAQRAFDSLNEVIVEIVVVPGDPASVQVAIAQAEAAVDRKAAPYRGNPFVDPVVKALKEKYREQIIERGRGKA